jgi:transposase-like protein
LIVLRKSEVFEQLVQQRLRQAIRLALINVLEEEVSAFIGASPYQRTHLSVLRTRGGHHTQVFQRYRRRRDELDSAITGMFIAGTNQARVGEVIETCSGPITYYGFTGVLHIRMRI